MFLRRSISFRSGLSVVFLRRTVTGDAVDGQGRTATVTYKGILEHLKYLLILCCNFYRSPDRRCNRAGGLHNHSENSSERAEERDHRQGRDRSRGNQEGQDPSGQGEVPPAQERARAVHQREEQPAQGRREQDQAEGELSEPAEFRASEEDA